MSYRYLVIDSSAFASSQLEAYLSARTKNRVIIPDSTAIELFQNETWTLARNGLFKQYKDRIFFSDSSGPILQAELEGRKPSILAAPLTRAFIAAINVDGEAEAKQLAHIRDNLLDTEDDYHANRKIFLKTILTHMNKALQDTGGTLKRDAAIHLAAATAQRGLAKGFSPSLIDAPYSVFLKAYPLAARYVALLASLLVEHLEAKGSATAQTDTLINIFTQRDNVLIASLFDGLLSTDEQANTTYDMLKQNLAVLSKVGVQSVH
ncbi:hypothetical protein IQ22_00359 [Pseudomonas duriflava]|uniref:Uncharacterized protein n=1 Tax=Pseudomonas duriflava TaxID=459528 RepID=A0A562QPG7_9PSED|nr:hypothetical protein [Pseudomonas duriflava]TWI58651.1 hypothetical protein IQ22_00359 [Pseudomonas duriflava]